MAVVRIGIIGIGNMGSAHAISIHGQKIDGMVLSAVCDTDSDRINWAIEIFGESVKTFIDYRKMINSGIVDAVMIATPHKLHPIIAEEAFSAGLHVLTEKPAGIDIVSVEKMNRAAIASNKVFGIMYNQRTNPLYSELKKHITEGKLGELKRFVWIINNWYRTQTYYDSGSWRATWNGEGGGVLLNQCPHNIDIWQWIMGMPIKLRAFCKYGNYHNISVEDDATIYAEYENNASAVFITSTGEYPGTNRMEVSGTRGKAVIENGVLKFFLLEKDEREICMHSTVGMPTEKIYTEEIKQLLPESGHIGILQNFADAIIKGDSLIAPGIEGINGLSISNAAYLSDWLDTSISFPFDGEVFLAKLKEKQENELTKERKSTRENINGDYIDRWLVRW